MNKEPPSRETSLVILLGASAFPTAPALTSSKAYANSARRLKDYLLGDQGFGLPKKNFLNLFDSELTLRDQLREIRNFLQGKAKKGFRDVLVYYIGHGGFDDDQSSEYYLALQATEAEVEFHTSMPIRALAKVLKSTVRQLRQYLILDSCFSAAAFSAFQSGPLEVARQKTLDSFPTTGISLLCASGPKDPAKLLPDQEYTAFSNALLGVLEEGDSAEPELLSLATIAALVKERIQDSNMDDAARPQVLSPSQKEGEIALLPFFPNPALRANTALRKMQNQISELRDLQMQQSKEQGELSESVKSIVAKVRKLEEQPTAAMSSKSKSPDEFYHKALSKFNLHRRAKDIGTLTFALAILTWGFATYAEVAGRDPFTHFAVLAVQATLILSFSISFVLAVLAVRVLYMRDNTLPILDEEESDVLLEKLYDENEHSGHVEDIVRGARTIRVRLVGRITIGFRAAQFNAGLAAPPGMWSALEFFRPILY